MRRPPEEQLGSLSGLRMTADEFFAVGETYERYELVGGVIVYSPSATVAHQRVLGEAAFQLGRCSGRGRGGLVLAMTDVQFSRAEVYCPDVVAYAPGRVRAVPDRLNLPPDLVVEVLSPARERFDLETKRDDYGRFGVREYWVLDPATADIRCWRRKPGRAGGPRKLVEARVGGRTLKSSSLPGFELNLDQLREAVGLPRLRLRPRG